MTDLPSPPPVEPNRQVSSRQVPSRQVSASSNPDAIRPGDLTMFWRGALALAWLAAFFAYAAVWQASVQIGIATWWVGPRSSPAPALVRAIPFFLAIVGVLLALYSRRRLASLSLGVAVVSVFVAIPDFSRSTGLGVVELMISLSMIVISAAAFSGRYRFEPVVQDQGPTPVDRAASAPTGPVAPTDTFAPPPPPPSPSNAPAPDAAVATGSDIASDPAR